MMNPSAARTVLGTHMSADISKEAVLALSPTQLGKLGEDPGSAERKKYVTEAIQNLAHGYRKEIEKETNIDPATGLPEKDTAGNLTGRQFKVGTGKYELDTAAITAAIAANPALKNLESLPGLVKHMEHSSNWVSAIN